MTDRNKLTVASLLGAASGRAEAQQECGIERDDREAVAELMDIVEESRRLIERHSKIAAEASGCPVEEVEHYIAKLAPCFVTFGLMRQIAQIMDRLEWPVETEEDS